PGNLADEFETPWQTAINDVKGFLFDNEDSLKNKVLHFFSGTEEGSLYALLEAGRAHVATWPGLISIALSNMGTILWENVGLPIVRILNWMIDRVNNFLTSVNNVLGGATSLLSGMGINTEIGVGTIDRISEDPPAFLAGATEMFQGGFLKGP